MDETDRFHRFMTAKARLSLRDRLVRIRRRRHEAEFMVAQYRAFLATLPDNDSGRTQDRRESADRS